MSDEQMTLFDADEWTSSPEAIPASPSHSPASKKALKTIATSGRQCLSLLSKRPAFVVGENVAGHITLGLRPRLFDLEGEGYTARPFVIPACAVDAPHRRDRVWVVAEYVGDSNSGNSARDEPASVTGRRQPGLEARREAVPDSDSARQRASQGCGQDGRDKAGHDTGRLCPTGPTPQAADTRTWTRRDSRCFPARSSLADADSKRGRRWDASRQDATTVRKSPDIRGKTPEEWKRGSLNPAWVEWLMGYPEG